jgi:S-adenosylmethionine/arginine decarboxylase-like enzyme
VRSELRDPDGTRESLGSYPWAESGCSIYTWSDRRLFSLEIFSCKDFDAGECASFANRALQATECVQRQLMSALGAAADGWE